MINFNISKQSCISRGPLVTQSSKSKAQIIEIYNQCFDFFYQLIPL